MPHHNSVLHDVLKQLPWGEMERLVAAHGADAKQRGFTSKKQLVALLYGQLAGATSLRDIVDGLRSHERQLYHLGIDGAPDRAWPMPTRTGRARCSPRCSA